MSNENELTYVFQNEGTKEIMWFMPVAKLLKFLSVKELGFSLYNASGNTCQINGMLSEVITKNQFLTQMLKNFASFDIKKLYSVLQELALNSRDGWINNKNPLLTIQLFNNNSPSDKDKENKTDYNRNLDISCSGVKDFDIFGVVYDDFLSKYYDKAIKNEKNYKKLLYYRNFNITEDGKLVTGLSNFNTEVFRSELLKKNCFIDSDMKVYNFSDCQYHDKIKALFKLITENVFVQSNQEYNLYEITDFELTQHITEIDQQVSGMLKGYYPENNFHVQYDVATRRFLMVDEKGKQCDATSFIYSTLCDSLKAKNLVKSSDQLKYFIENENNSGIMDKVIASHYEEKFNLVKNIAEYFESDLLDSDLKAIEFAEKEKNDMKKYFFAKSPLEFFFRKTDEIKSKLDEDKNCDIKNHPDKEDSITKYILKKNIDKILTDQGKEFLNMIKKITSNNKYFQDRITKDETFEEYKSQNDENCTYKNDTQNKKTKIEFSVLKALIESIDSGSNVAYQNFFVQLSYYLNYFFCNKNNLSKKELRESIKKEIDEINKKINNVERKKEKRAEKRTAVIDKHLPEKQERTQLKQIDDEYGTLSYLTKESSKYNNEINIFCGKIFVCQQIKLNLESPAGKNPSIYLDRFKKYFLGYDENIFDIVRPKIKEFVKANELFKDKAIEADTDEERIDIKTSQLIDAVKNYLAGITQKITFDWFNLCLNYVCQNSKTEFNKIMDGVSDQDDLEKNTDANLSFLITDLIIEYKKALEEIESDKTGKKQQDSCNNFGVMNLFHLLQSFINAGYIFTYDSNSDDMRQYIYNAHEVEFLMNHHPKKLIEEIRQNKTKSIDGLIACLFKNTSLENNDQIKKLCKMSIYTFSKITASVDHMTQINMAQFFSELAGIKRKFSHGVMLDENGAVGCFMVPIQKALEICKTNAPEQFKKDINEMLPKLPKGMKWADINQECDLFLDQNKYKMLSPVEVASMFFSDNKLINGFKEAKYRFCFLNILINRYQCEFEDFLSCDCYDSYNVIHAYIYECAEQKTWDLDDIKAWFDFLNETILTPKDDKKIGLNATKDIILLMSSMTNVLIDIISYDKESEDTRNKAQDIISKCPINIITHLIKNNSIQSETLDKDTWCKVFSAFDYVYRVKKEEFENAIMLLPDEVLLDKLQVISYRFHCLHALIQKHPEEWKQFLQSDLDDTNNLISNAINTCIKRKVWSPEGTNNLLSFINKIIESNENDKKIGLNALEKFIRLTCKLTEFMVVKNDKERWKYIIVEYPINIITNLISNIYFAWNDIVKDQNQKDMLESIFKSAMKVLNNVYKNVNKDDILKNQDLTLWLYLIYKKIYFDSDFLKAQQTNEKQLNSSNVPHFLREYKISDGDEKISEKNIFYADDRTKEFINEIRKLGCSELVPLVEIFPKVLEAKKKANTKLFELVKLKFLSDIKSISNELTNPEKLFDMAVKSENISAVFYAIKKLYRNNCSDKLKELLLETDMERNIACKLCIEFIIQPNLNYVDKNKLENMKILFELVLKDRMLISLCSAVYLLKSISVLSAHESGKNYLNSIFKDIFQNDSNAFDKDILQNDSNAFDAVVDIIGQIFFSDQFYKMDDKVLADYLNSLCRYIDDIYSLTYQGQTVPVSRATSYKNLAWWIYLTYRRIYHTRFSNKVNIFLSKLFGKDPKLCQLRSYKIDNGIEEMKEKDNDFDKYHVPEFIKWINNNYSLKDSFPYKWYLYGNLSNEILIQLVRDYGDLQAFNYITEDKIREVFLSNEKDNIIQKIYNALEKTNNVNRLPEFIKWINETYSSKDGESDLYKNWLNEILIKFACDHVAPQALNYITDDKRRDLFLSTESNNVIQKIFDAYRNRVEKEKCFKLHYLGFDLSKVDKMSFQVALSEMRRIHHFYKLIRKNRSYHDEIEDSPSIGLISQIVEKIYFVDDKFVDNEIEGYIHTWDYFDFLNIIAEEIHGNKITEVDKREECSNPLKYRKILADIVKKFYFDQPIEYKRDVNVLLANLLLLHIKIIYKKNYIVNELSQNIEFNDETVNALNEQIDKYSQNFTYTDEFYLYLKIVTETWPDELKTKIQTNETSINDHCKSILKVCILAEQIRKKETQKETKNKEETKDTTENTTSNEIPRLDNQPKIQNDL